MLSASSSDSTCDVILLQSVTGIQHLASSFQNLNKHLPIMMIHIIMETVIKRGHVI